MTDFDPTEADTDFNQFDDATQYNRRATDKEDCTATVCPTIFVLERRVDRHRKELNEHIKKLDELKTMVHANATLVEKNSADTSEILEIVTLAKSFFKVLGWIGDKLKPLIALAIAIGSVVGIIFASGAKWGKP